MVGYAGGTGRVEEWFAWIKADDAKARAAKAAYTRSLEHTEAPEHLQPIAMAKVAGVWRQVLPLGLSGDADEGTLQAEPITGPTQELELTLKRMDLDRNKRSRRGGRKRRGHKQRKKRRW